MHIIKKMLINYFKFHQSQNSKAIMNIESLFKFCPLPRAHFIAVIACSFLVLLVALWPSQGRSVIVEIRPTIEPDTNIELFDNNSTLQQISETVSPGDTISTLFERSGAGVTTLYSLLADETIKKPLEKIYPGQEFIFTFNNDSILKKINFNESNTVSYSIDIDNDKKATITRTERVPDIQTKYATATISSSLFLAGAEAGLTDNMIMQVANVFGWDIDFALDIREGDQFSLLYEENYLDGKKLSDGQILAAKFINNGRQYTALRYTDASGHTDYYSPDGKSMRKAFLRTPLDVFRISSSFNPSRMHPVLNRIVAHKGTDYAAPTGTPIKASGDGKVIKAYTSATYGNVVVLQHGESISTLYAHMSKFSKYARVGKRVKQGQIIGYVGTTGRSNGPHLHYEFRVNGVHKNPQTVKLPTAKPLNSEYLADFNAYAENLSGQLEVYDSAYAAGLTNLNEAN
ncbi:peptidoglycan DD-metalloendopeptidase family protein [Reinekea thalattae]|uniref:Peptidoglycan DD-metalloendopeptidase family protein n=1 Tax=Reinekea thalattae TaxID=2593301 RepID=A0A5C8ZCL4_9GAMM|nr:peptidoglycan DD-metalloendopeptidase family protein [Reinekea thalattae]TXR54903.1 peptidoglycan DD-metalloendopeptidase family protein [Reinekea thalattae]